MPEIFDEGQKPVEIDDASLAQRQEDNLKAYESKYLAICDQIKEAQSGVEEINTLIKLRTDDLAQLYVQKTQELNDQIKFLTEQIDQKIKQSSALDLEIADKQGKSDSILLDLSDRQTDLDSQKAEIIKGSNILAAANEDLRRREEIIAEKETRINKHEKDTIDLWSAKINEADERESKAIAMEQINTAAKQSNDEALVNLSAREDEIKKAIDDLALKVSEASLVLASAETFKKEQEEFRIVKANFKLQLDEYQANVNQVKTTIIAQANKQAELNQREAAVKQAEQKIAGG